MVRIVTAGAAEPQGAHKTVRDQGRQARSRKTRRYIFPFNNVLIRKESGANCDSRRSRAAGSVQSRTQPREASTQSQGAPLYFLITLYFLIKDYSASRAVYIYIFCKSFRTALGYGIGKNDLAKL